jgi:cytochrome P450
MAGLPPPHKTLKDVILDGKRIPKNTQIMYSLYAAQRDPDLCADAHEFKPERFLDANRHFVKDTGLSFIFSLGKRRCPGELLAKAEVRYSLACNVHYQ